MSWSWKLGRVAGIPIYVHWTFLILIAWVLIDCWVRTQDVASTLAGVAFVTALFGCIVLHELGHALTARRFGVKTSDITLLPIGGVARLQRIPEQPYQELLVALAGPAVNVVIVLVFYFVFGLRFPEPTNNTKELITDHFFSSLMAFNLFMALFNMLPAFPMDGGRVLRSLLALRLPYARATRLAASVGQFMAIVFGLLGLSAGNPFLLLIALFVWIGAESEAVRAEERFLLADVPVRTSMLTDFRTVSRDDSLGHAVELLLSGTQQDFPVRSPDGHALDGVLTRSNLMAGLARGGSDARVSEFVRSDIASVEANSPLSEAVSRLREGHGPCLQVVDHGQTVGLLTLENVGELLMVRAALAERVPPHGHSPAALSGAK
jgi:Zn-dependent protease/predicted transcriptional regulator